MWRSRMLKNYIKKLSSVILVLTMVYSVTFADTYSIYGGIKRDELSKKNTFLYEEMCFMSGKPILLKGTVTLPKVKMGRDRYKMSVKYSASDSSGKNKIDRKVTYDVEKKIDTETGEVITNWTIKPGGIKETVTIDSTNYELTSFEFDNSIISDVKPAISFNSGKLRYKKVFNTDDPQLDKGKKIIVIGESLTGLSYQNIWSSVNTLVVNEEIKFVNLPISNIKSEVGPYSGGDAEKDDSGKDKKETANWNANVKYIVSSKSQSKFDYIKNNVKTISFKKGLIKSRNTDETVEYEYDLPNFEEKLETENPYQDIIYKRNVGKITLDSYNFKNSTMLPLPKYVDIGGHWAEKSIFQLASIGAFDRNVSFYPDVFINRKQFARAILNTIDSVPAESEAKRKAEYVKSKRPGAKEQLFSDVRRDDENYIFIEGVYDKSLMIGAKNREFKPNRPLTRAEAVTVMIRAIGVNDIAPVLPFDTGFSDDEVIQDWAKPCIYMAKRLGIVNGYADGSFQPNKKVTRAEVSSMLTGLIKHLRKDITIDYKEKLRDEM